MTQVECALTQSLQDIWSAGVFELHDKTLRTSCLHITEDRLKAYHATLTDFILVLDVQEGISTRMPQSCRQGLYHADNLDQWV